MADLSAIVLSSKRLTSNMSKINYVLITSNIPVMDKMNMFKHYDSQNDQYFTSMMNSSYDQLVHRSEIFYDLLTLCYLFHIRGQSIIDLRQFFLKMYNLLFIGGTFNKCLCSIFKYSNIISMSAYSKIQNLIDKYLGKNIPDRSIHYYYSRKVLENIKHNIKMKDFIQSKMFNENLREEQIFDLKDVDFKFMNLSSRNFECMIEMSVFYTFCFKDTTNYHHAIQNFLKKYNIK